MNVILSLDHRFARTPDGIIWSRFFKHSFWTRYLDVFDGVRVVARVRDVDSVPQFWAPSNGEQVSFIPVPHYHGPREFFQKRHEVQQVCRNAVAPGDAAILRLPSPVSANIYAVLARTGHPYGVEVVGDPYDVFAPGAFKHPLRPFFRWWYPLQMRRQCAGACAASYVTEETLQHRYPAAAFSTHYSSIELPDSWLLSSPRPIARDKQAFTILFLGTLDQLYKAPDVLLEAFALCVHQGMNLRLRIGGEGRHQQELQAQAEKLNIAQQVEFLGQLPAGEAVQAQLDAADLFVLPSRQEGLPRVIIEAMARALPVIGSTVGGIPELLPAQDMIPPNQSQALSSKIREILSDADRMAQTSARNLERAGRYRENLLRERRIALYRQVKTQTESWHSVWLKEKTQDKK